MTGGGLRRVIHASTAVVALLAAAVGWDWIRIGLGVGVVGAAALEVARLKSLPFRSRIERLVPVFRPAEAQRPSGAFWLIVGYSAASWIPAPGATAGILCGALADPAAAAVGSRWGGGVAKSWAGTAAAALVASAVLLSLGTPGLVVTAGALIAAGLERFSGPLDDNLVIAPGVSIAVWAITSAL